MRQANGMPFMRILSIVLTLLLLTVSSIYATELPEIPEGLLQRFHVCTVATYRHPNLEKLIKSCQKHQINLDILGLGHPYFGNGTKFVHLAQYLNTLDDGDVVMFVDAFDVLIVANKKKILRKFLREQTPVLMSAEINCTPYEHLASSYPPAPTPFKYINTGSFIGYVGSLKKWLNALQPIDPGGCDQGQTTVHYLKKPKNRSFFTLDHHCRLFLTLYMVDEKDVKIDTKNKIVECLITHSYPCVIHANGQSFQAWNKIYQQLIKK